MSLRVRRVRTLSLPVALVVSLTLASQVYGAIWSGPVTVTGAGAADGMVTLGSSTAVVLFHDHAGLYVTRSLDSGGSWGTKRKLATHSSCAGTSDAAIAGSGRKVHVAWIADNQCSAGAVVYRRSMDRAQSFGQPVVIAPPIGPQFVDSLSIASGPDGVVAILWEEIECADNDCDQQRTSYRIRVSNDDGLSFGEATTVAATLNEFSGGSALAIGDGVIHVAYLRNDTELRVRRSLDGGSTWLNPNKISNRVVFDDIAGPKLFAMVASGNGAAVAYLNWNSPGEYLLLRHSSDAGASWSAPVSLSAVDRRQVWTPRLTWQGGTLRVAFTRCSLSCDGSPGSSFDPMSVDGGGGDVDADPRGHWSRVAGGDWVRGSDFDLLNNGTFDPVLVIRGAAT